MNNRKYFEFTCLGCQGVFKRRSDKANQSLYCRPCRGRKTLTKHDMSRGRLYKIWQGMRQRCENPKDNNFKRYGAIGITVCPSWSSFKEFAGWAIVNGYQETLTLDRSNNNLGYNPSNCRWITPLEQSHNRKNGLTWKAVKEIRKLYETSTYIDIAEMYGVHKHTVLMVCHNKTWHDPNFIPVRHHRWNKSPSPIPLPKLFA